MIRYWLLNGKKGIREAGPMILTISWKSRKSMFALTLERDIADSAVGG